MRWSFAVLFVAGCDHLLQLDDITPHRDAASDVAIDARPDAAPPPPSDICLDETFSSGSIDMTTWTQYWGGPQQPPTPTLTVANGDLEIGLFAGTPSATMAYNGLDSIARFMITRGSVEMQLVSVPSDGNAETQLYMALDATHQYLVAIKGTTMTLFVRDNNNMPFPTTFDRNTEHYLRIRDGGDGNVYVDTAVTAGTWTARIATPAPISFSSLTVGLNAGTDSPGIGSAQTAKLDNVIVRAPACLH